jgi:predicted TPR repeat methyltransferase
MIELQETLDLLESNQLDQSLRKCLDIVAVHPQDANAQHLLGLIYAKLRQIPLAITCFSKAITLDPTQSIYHNNISNAYKLINNLQLAILHLHEALRLSPNNAESYNNLGSLYYTIGNIKQAIPQFEKAIRLNPNSWEAHYNLANCHIKLDSVLQAIAHYESTLKLNPQHSNAKLNLAMTLVSIKDYDKALRFLKEASDNNPHHSELQGHLATAYLELGDSAAAITQYAKALELDPNRSEWQHNMAVLQLRNQQPDLAKQHFNSAIKLQPDNPIAQHMLAALNETPALDAPPAEYVASLFDQYASYYNKHMTQTLKYEVPKLLRHEISAFIDLFTKQQHVLDLGCGTGLCGIYFRDLARFFVGVDLSMQMLEHAKALGAYDALCCCNILETIPGMNQESFELILAADVFVYLGALDKIFALVASAIKPQGLFTFTIEEHESTEKFVLKNTGRYSHSQQYVSNLAEQYNFKILSNKAITPRIQNDTPIVGRLYVLIR